MKYSFSNTPFAHKMKKMKSILFAVMGKSQRYANYVLNLQVCFLNCCDSVLGFLLFFCFVLFCFCFVTKNQHFFDLVLVQFAKMFETGEL